MHGRRRGRREASRAVLMIKHHATPACGPFGTVPDMTYPTVLQVATHTKWQGTILSLILYDFVSKLDAFLHASLKIQNCIKTTYKIMLILTRTILHQIRDKLCLFSGTKGEVSDEGRRHFKKYYIVPKLSCGIENIFCTDLETKLSTSLGTKVWWVPKVKFCDKFFSR